MRKTTLTLFVLLNIFAFFLVNMSKSSEIQSTINVPYHILSKKNIQELIDSGELGCFNNDNNSLFIQRFNRTVELGSTENSILNKRTNKKYTIIGYNHELKRTKEDIKDTIKNLYGEDNADLTTQKSGSQIVLADSICVYYGIKIEDLIKIVKGKENSEIKELFNTCLKSINEKFKTQEKAQENQTEQNKIADLVVKKLIEKLNKEENSQLKNEIADLVVKKLEGRYNTSSIPLAPTLPTDIFF